MDTATVNPRRRARTQQKLAARKAMAERWRAADRAVARQLWERWLDPAAAWRRWMDGERD